VTMNSKTIVVLMIRLVIKATNSEVFVLLTRETFVIPERNAQSLET
jgi:hypothetical protein